MQSADLRRDESEVLKALYALDVLDSEAEAEFDALVRAASLACGTPIALISLVDATRQWFKANLGLPGVAETPRDVAFCAHAVLGDELFEVPDATRDPRFADNPLVSGRPDIRFYAGAPVRLSGGQRIGTLCIIDHQPRQLNDAQREILRSLALVAAQAFEGRQASLRLRKSEDFLDRTGRVAGVGGWELDIASGEVTWSDETRRIHGVAPDFSPALGEAINFYAPESRPVIKAAVERGMATGEGWDLELPLVRANGDRIWARAVGQVEFREGKPSRLVGAFQDISERKDLELKLAGTLAELKDLYENLPCGYHSLDASGVFVHVNATALSWLGCTREELVGKRRVTEFFTPESQEQFRQNFGRLLSHGSIVGLEFELIPRSGTRRRVSITATAIRDEHGQFLKTRTVMFDITELRRVKQHAEELDRLLAERSEMLNVLAHEVRQPLNNASAALQSAAATLNDRGERAASEQVRRAQTVLGSVMSGLDNTLAVASLLAGTGELTLADTDIDLLVAICVADMPLHGRGRIRVVRQTPTRTIWADAGLMRLALRNLLANALEWSGDHLPIEIKISESDSPLALMIDVVDQGPGIDPSVLARLFERGVRGSAMAPRPSHGLGLYIVRRAMALQGGHAMLLHTGASGTTLRLQLIESAKVPDL